MNKIDWIKTAEPEELEDILKALLKRYREVYPEWDVSVITLEKTADKKEQLDRMIQLLEKMKEQPI